ncbi:MAG: PEGA domain-containing protein [Kofleriaceae bacterium]
MAAGTALRLVTQCTTLEEFVRVFRARATADGITVPAISPTPPEGTRRIVVALASRATILDGDADVDQDADGGYTVQFSRLDVRSRGLLNFLVEAGGRGLVGAIPRHLVPLGVPIGDPATARDLDELAGCAAEPMAARATEPPPLRSTASLPALRNVGAGPPAAGRVLPPLAAGPAGPRGALPLPAPPPTRAMAAIADPDAVAPPSAADAPAPPTPAGPRADVAQPAAPRVPPAAAGKPRRRRDSQPTLVGFAVGPVDADTDPNRHVPRAAPPPSRPAARDREATFLGPAPVRGVGDLTTPDVRKPDRDAPTPTPIATTGSGRTRRGFAVRPDPDSGEHLTTTVGDDLATDVALALPDLPGDDLDPLVDPPAPAEPAHPGVAMAVSKRSAVPQPVIQALAALAGAGSGPTPGDDVAVTAPMAGPPSGMIDARGDAPRPAAAPGAWATPVWSGAPAGGASAHARDVARPAPTAPVPAAPAPAPPTASAAPRPSSPSSVHAAPSTTPTAPPTASTTPTTPPTASTAPSTTPTAPVPAQPAPAQPAPALTPRPAAAAAPAPRAAPPPATPHVVAAPVAPTPPLPAVIVDLNPPGAGPAPAGFPVAATVDVGPGGYPMAPAPAPPPPIYPTAQLRAVDYPAAPSPGTSAAWQRHRAAMSEDVGDMTELVSIAPIRRRRWPVIAITSAVILVIALTALAMSGSSSSPTEPPGAPAAGTAPTGDDVPPAPRDPPPPEAPPPPAAPAALTACTVTFTSSPDGAEVVLRGEVVGTTPLTRDLPCDADEATIRRDRYQSQVVRLTLAPGPQTVAARLERPQFTITVTSRPAGAAVTVAGRAVGTTPTRIKVAGFEGTPIVVKRQGYADHTERVYATRNGQQVNVPLKRR